MTRIQRLSTYLIYSCNLILIMVFPFRIFLRLFPHANIPDWITIGDVFRPTTPLSKFIAISSDFIERMPFFLSIYILRLIFKNYKLGKIFTNANAKHYKSLGIIYVIKGLVTEPLAHTLETLAETIHNPPGERILSFRFASSNIEAIFFGACIILISWIMIEGLKLQEDQSVTI